MSAPVAPPCYIVYVPYGRARGFAKTGGSLIVADKVSSVKMPNLTSPLTVFLTSALLCG